MSTAPGTAPTQDVVTPRASLRQVVAYTPGGDETPCAVDLSDNTNLWGTPPAAERALRDVAASRVASYPSLYGAELARAAGAYLGVPPECVATGCGSDDVLDATFRAFADPDGRIAFPAPTFTMVPVFARLNALEPAPVPFRADYDADVDALLAVRARVVYLCVPNNPTGTPLPRATIERVLAESDAMVLVDEAYAEFSGTSALDLLPRHERLIVTRTMSKAFGLAGLRVGFGVAAPGVVAELRKALGPYKVNAMAEAAATAALREDVAWVHERARDAVEVRERLAAALRALGLDPLPSAANFLLVPVPDARGLADRLRARGVALRAFPSLPPVSPALAATAGSALRIGVGPWPLVQTALDALRAELAGTPAEARP
jgi:histidinol-phosphate aminotransferase